MAVDTNELAEALFGGSSAPEPTETPSYATPAEKGVKASDWMTPWQTEEEAAAEARGEPEKPVEAKSGFGKTEEPAPDEAGSQAISEDDLSTMSEEYGGFTEEETAWIKENGFSKAQVEQVVEKAKEIERAATEVSVEHLQEVSNGWRAESEAQFSKAEIEDYAAAIRENADEEAIAMLNVMGVANHPSFVKLILSLTK